MKKYCPLVKDPQDGYQLECSKTCAWYVDRWEDEDSIHDAKCAIGYTEDIANMLRFIVKAMYQRQEGEE